MNEQKRTENSKKRMLLALDKHCGIVSKACKTAKVGRTAFYEWLDKDIDFRNQVNECREIQIDFVENALMNLIEQGNTTAIIYYLKTKGKQRGWSEKYELQHSIKKEPLHFDSIFITEPSDNDEHNYTHIERISDKD